jgi:hypothetical protein
LLARSIGKNTNIPSEASMTATFGAITDNFVFDQGPLADKEVDRLEGLALKELLNNRMTSELQSLLNDFGAYGASGIDTIVEHFNERLCSFWSPYRLRAFNDENGYEFTIKLMRMENGKLNPSGPSLSIRAANGN